MKYYLYLKLVSKVCKRGYDWSQEQSERYDKGLLWVDNCPIRHFSTSRNPVICAGVKRIILMPTTLINLDLQM